MIICFVEVLIVGENINVKDLNMKQGKKLLTMAYVHHTDLKKKKNLGRIVKLTQVQKCLRRHIYP